MAQHGLILHDYLPATANQLLRAHWSKRSRLKRADAELVGTLAKVKGIPPATGKRRVDVRLVCQHAGHRRDPDASLKSLLDALVKSGLLVDDSPDLCELGSVRVEVGGMRRTEVVLTDV